MNKKIRPEDRRSCHNVSLVLGLAVLAKNVMLADYCYHAMLTLVTPVTGQAAN